MGFDFVWPTSRRESCALMLSECLRCGVTVRLLGYSGHKDLPTGNSPFSRGQGTCAHEKINYPRPNSVGQAIRVCLGSLEEGVSSMSRKLCSFNIELELGFEGCVDSWRLSTLSCMLGRQVGP